MNLIYIYRVFRNQGIKYFLFRSLYEVKRKSGLLKNKFPSNPSNEKLISLSEWKKLNTSFIFQSRNDLKIIKDKNLDLKNDFQRIIKGEIKYFNKDWKLVTDWTTNPDTGHAYNMSDHWTQVEDLSKEAGDIKYVWEKSRFSWLLTVIRFDYHYDEDNSEFVFDQIEDWIGSNPVNMGPNYKCSQEISLRCINWIFALYFYKDSKALTKDRWNKIFHFIYWQVNHVYDNINFSRICVRNNHAITECMMIYFAGLLFPFLSEANKWKTNGKKWLEEEIGYQVYDDGTFLQFSHNYQRVLVQLLTWTISISKIHKEQLNDTTISRAKAVVRYMENCCIGKNGQLPNYGNNDGALFFKLSNQDYSDYRPQINALYFALTSKYIYKDIEESQWLVSKPEQYNVDLIESGHAFNTGGIYSIQDDDGSYTFMKCVSYQDRPAQADNMHIDLWLDGYNYFRDSGTYKYNTEESLVNYFGGTAGHNTIMIGDHNQMTKGSRFIWFDWTKDVTVNAIKNDNGLEYSLAATMFHSLGNPVKHNRSVFKYSNKLTWIINDAIIGEIGGNAVKQLWHPNPQMLDRIKISAIDSSGTKLKLIKTKGWWSEYYGIKEEVPLWYFETYDKSIITTIELIK